MQGRSVRLGGLRYSLVGTICFLFLWVIMGSPATAWAAGGEFIGNDECLDCHEDKEVSFGRSIHSKAGFWANGEAVTCETCHGAGGEHAESDGQVLLTLRADAAAACTSCHEGNLAQRYWQGSAHDLQDVDCLACHSIHDGFDNLLLTRAEPDTCYECHVEQRADMFKRSKHPLRDSTHRGGQRAKMSCSSCHNPHGSQSDKLIAANSVNDKCYECHQEMKAPVVWEHSPVKENCLSCHDAHGSNHERMLAFKEPRLCTQCHEAGRHQTIAGEPTSFMVMNRSCSNCHAQVHGTNHPSGLKLKR